MKYLFHHKYTFVFIFIGDFGGVFLKVVIFAVERSEAATLILPVLVTPVHIYYTGVICPSFCPSL